MQFTLHHKPVTASTNLDALAGRPGDVFTADEQLAGRGRLDHKWLSAPGENLAMSVVLDVSALPLEQVATLPLVVGGVVAEALEAVGGRRFAAQVKWPNDVLIAGRKLCGILCERHGDLVIVGIGINVAQRVFPPDLAPRATSLALVLGEAPAVATVRDAVLERLSIRVAEWREGGFAPMVAWFAARDFLRGKYISVLRVDDDPHPAQGLCEGVLPSGALLVAGESIYAGEAHVQLYPQA